MKPFKKYEDLVQKEAGERAVKIESMVEKFLDLCTDNELSINDLQLIVNQIIQNANTVFLSRLVSEFREEKKETTK